MTDKVDELDIIMLTDSFTKSEYLEDIDQTWYYVEVYNVEKGYYEVQYRKTIIKNTNEYNFKENSYKDK